MWQANAAAPYTHTTRILHYFLFDASFKQRTGDTPHTPLGIVPVLLRAANAILTQLELAFAPKEADVRSRAARAWCLASIPPSGRFNGSVGLATRPVERLHSQPIIRPIIPYHAHTLALRLYARSDTAKLVVRVQLFDRRQREYHA